MSDDEGRPTDEELDMARWLRKWGHDPAILMLIYQQGVAHGSGMMIAALDEHPELMDEVREQAEGRDMYTEGAEVGASAMASVPGDALLIIYRCVSRARQNRAGLN